MYLCDVTTKLSVLSASPHAPPTCTHHSTLQDLVSLSFNLKSALLYWDSQRTVRPQERGLREQMENYTGMSLGLLNLELSFHGSTLQIRDRKRVKRVTFNLT